MLDFGVAKLRGEQALDTSDKLTSTGMIIGTAPYMAPEQWQARPDIDGRADIYSLGVMLFEMLCGRRPYSANNAYEWIVLHMEATPPDLTTFGVSAPLSRVVRRMLAGKPELRQQSMREVIQDLRTASRGLRNIAAWSNDGIGSNAVTAISAGPQNDTSGTPPPYVPHPSVVQSGPQQPTFAGQAQQYPQQPQYQQQPYQQQSYPSTDLVARPPRQWLRRIGEFALMALVVVGYFIYNWRETMSSFQSLMQSLKPHF